MLVQLQLVCRGWVGRESGSIPGDCPVSVMLIGNFGRQMAPPGPAVNADAESYAGPFLVNSRE